MEIPNRGIRIFSQLHLMFQIELSNIFDRVFGVHFPILIIFIKFTRNLKNSRLIITNSGFFFVFGNTPFITLDTRNILLLILD